jgi:hypothetical protein
MKTEAQGLSTRFARAIAFALSVLLVGCADSPTTGGDPNAAIRSAPGDTAAPDRAAPNADRATIYVYRDELFGGVIRMAVAVDGREVGLTQGKTYLVFQVEPGRHVLTSQGQPGTALTIDVRGGKTYYVWQEVKKHFLSFAYRSRLELVDEMTGRAGLEECKLSEVTR